MLLPRRTGARAHLIVRPVCVQLFDVVEKGQIRCFTLIGLLPKRSLSGLPCLCTHNKLQRIGIFLLLDSHTTGFNVVCHPDNELTAHATRSHSPCSNQTYLFNKFGLCEKGTMCHHRVGPCLSNGLPKLSANTPTIMKSLPSQSPLRSVTVVMLSRKLAQKSHRADQQTISFFVVFNGLGLLQYLHTERPERICDGYVVCKQMIMAVVWACGANAVRWCIVQHPVTNHGRDVLIGA
jgi:hypothetical protein